MEVEDEAAACASRAVGQAVPQNGTVALLAAEGRQGGSQRRADDGGHAVGDALADAVAVTHPTGPLALVGAWKYTEQDTGRGKLRRR